MNVNMINPFIEGTVTTFNTMCGCEPTMNGRPHIKTDADESYDLIGIIGLTGSVKGSMLMTMKKITGQKAVGAFLMEDMVEEGEDLMDGFGEILNIIAGAAAAKLKDLEVNLALPTVLIGTNQKVHSQQSSPWIVIPMTFPEWGKFNIEVSMEEV